jgi:RHS repeat-associated protein
LLRFLLMLALLNLGSAAKASYDAAAAWFTESPSGTLSLAPNQYGEPTQMGAGTSIGYDNAGRVNAITDAAGTCAVSYTNGQIASKSYSSGVLSGDAVGHTYNSLGQLTAVTLPGSVSIGYTYNSDGTLHTVTTAAELTGTYSNYNAVNGRAQSFSLGAALSVSGSFDGLGRILGQASTAAGKTSSYDTYEYDADGHCHYRNAPEGSWTYTYDSYGYLHTAAGWHTLNYSFDATGRPAHTTDYRATEQINSGTVDVLGSVVPGALVTINGTSAMVNGTTGLFSQTYTPPTNTWQTYNIIGSLTTGGTTAVAQQTRNVFVPPLTETLGYDASGDLDSDARWSYGWNTFGQLTSITETNPYLPSMATQIACVYDMEGHRVQKTVSIGGKLSKRTTTLWDGWRPAMETDYSGTSNAVEAQRYYTWGPDVSGSINGAAGIGGLVEIMEKIGTATIVSLPIYDGIGNVVGYVDGTTGVRVATFSYGPFGELLAAYGPRATLCPFLYQTKECDPETHYYNFGKRLLNPMMGWISRDPIREAGGINLYAYCNDQPVGNYDPIGEDAVVYINDPAGYARAIALQKAGEQDPSKIDPLWLTSQHIHIIPAFEESYKPFFSGMVNGTEFGGRNYDAGSFIGTEGAWFFDNAPEATTVSNWFNSGKSLALLTKGAATAIGVRLPGVVSAADEAVLQSLERAAPNSEQVFGGSMFDAGFPNVNPEGYPTNCVNCAIATDATLAGRPASALSGGYESLNVLENEFRGNFQSVRGSVDISNILSQSGNGARGIVAGNWMNGVGGHVFNVINDNGIIEFVDGQTGIGGSLHFYNMQNIRFLPTAPRMP